MCRMCAIKAGTLRQCSYSRQTCSCFTVPSKAAPVPLSPAVTNPRPTNNYHSTRTAPACQACTPCTAGWGLRWSFQHPAARASTAAPAGRAAGAAPLLSGKNHRLCLPGGRKQPPQSPGTRSAKRPWSVGLQGRQEGEAGRGSGRISVERVRACMTVYAQRGQCRSKHTLQRGSRVSPVMQAAAQQLCAAASRHSHPPRISGCMLAPPRWQLRHALKAIHSAAPHLEHGARAGRQGWSRHVPAWRHAAARCARRPRSQRVAPAAGWTQRPPRSVVGKKEGAHATGEHKGGSEAPGNQRNADGSLVRQPQAQQQSTARLHCRHQRLAVPHVERGPQRCQQQQQGRVGQHHRSGQQLHGEGGERGSTRVACRVNDS